MRQFSIIYHKDKYLSRLIKAFLDEVQRFPADDSTLPAEEKGNLFTTVATSKREEKKRGLKEKSAFDLSD